MQAQNDRLTLSPSDLTAYLACPHLATLELALAHGRIEKPHVDNAQADLIRRKGDEHEARYLQQLRDAGRTDTKLARHAKPAAVLQLCFYTQELARIQGSEPERMHVVLGTGVRESFRPGDFAAYYRRVRERFARFVAEPPPTYPYPCAHCPICDFKERCEEQWEADDHLVRVARIRRDQIERLGAVGITTLTSLGQAARGTAVPRMAPSTFETLRDQAELQLAAEPAWHLLEPEVERGFGLMPKPSPGDLFFDMEGDPFFDPGRGLEYLFGIWSRDRGYEAIWGHDRASEQAAFERLVDLIHERLREHPDLHVYHTRPTRTRR